MSIVSSGGSPTTDDDLSVSLQAPSTTATVQQTAIGSTDGASAQELFHRGPTWYTGSVKKFTIKDPAFVLYPDEYGSDCFMITQGKIRTDSAHHALDSSRCYSLPIACAREAFDLPTTSGSSKDCNLARTRRRGGEDPGPGPGTVKPGAYIDDASAESVLRKTLWEVRPCFEPEGKQGVEVRVSEWVPSSRAGRTQIKSRVKLIRTENDGRKVREV